MKLLKIPFNLPICRVFGVVFLITGNVFALPAALLYNHEVPEAHYLPKDNDVSSGEVFLDVPVNFFGTKFESIYVNDNGFLSFRTDIKQFMNIEFPLDYLIIAPFYSNVDIRKAGTISYYETNSPNLLQRASQNVQDTFSSMSDFQATNLFVVTWNNVGYYNQKSDKVNTYQVALITDGFNSFIEFLYPENGLQWIQADGDETGLPNARAQVGIISPEGEMFSLPGTGTEQVSNLEKLSNMNLAGQFIFKIDGPKVLEPDMNNDNLKGDEEALTCAEAPTACHIRAQCQDYESGYCCHCNPKYYGNGKFCIKNDGPLRVNGKINGKINGERLDQLDLQSYIVMADGRAYTAISKIPESIGFDIQSLQVLGSLIGYLFAKPLRNAQNGYQLTGGVFNATTTVKFLNTSQIVRIKQKYLGLDVFDQLRLEADIQGDIPNLPVDSKVSIDEYQEQYTMTSPGVIQMSGTRKFKYNNAGNREVEHYYNVEQSILFDYCKFENASVGETWKLRVGKNFISYENREQIIRFGLSNKISPLGDSDPCDEGRSKCGPNSACVVENDSYRCICNPGYQEFFTENQSVCADVNECVTGLHDCDYNAQCVNVVGSYTCRCNPGFEGNGQYCENAKSCANVRCNENAECVDQNGVANCKCQAGFTGDGQDCLPVVDFSCHVNNNCSPYGICTIDPHTNRYYCACLPGYVGDGYRCQPTQAKIRESTPDGEDMTTTLATPPKEVQRCLLGVCWCPQGYKIENGTTYCIPNDNPDEASTEPVPDTNGACNILNNCHKDASCLQSPGQDTYECVCNDGFEGNGYICEKERVSCTQLNNCDVHATCTYVEYLGKSKCVCNEGFEGDGYSCRMAAICINNEDCTTTEECLLTSSQRYECVCKEGHTRDSQHQCVTAQGSCGGGTCVENGECLYDDEESTHYCVCKEGFIGDGITECVPQPVGCDVLNNCGANARCEYSYEASTYKCKCNEGFLGDGFKCYTERNCINEPQMCDPRARCVPTNDRKFTCQCQQGFIGNGTVCKEISKHEGNFLLLNQGVSTLKVPINQSRMNRGKPIQVKVHQTAVGLDIDCLEGRVYWSDVSGRSIRSSNFDGANKIDFISNDLGSSEGLAVDWVSRNIYWTDSTKDTIEVANLDSKVRKVLFSTDLINPRGIAVHPQRGKLFWSDWNRKNPKIEWANADGTGRQVFLTGETVKLPNSLTIDYDEDRLYYADAGTKTIEMVHIDSKQRTTIASNCTYPFGITVTDKHVYWSDWISKKIERVEKYTWKRLEPLNIPIGGTGNRLYGLVAVPMRCPQLTNVCQYYKCQEGFICLPNGSGSRTCACGMKFENNQQVSTCGA